MNHVIFEGKQRKDESVLTYELSVDEETGALNIRITNNSEAGTFSKNEFSIKDAVGIANGTVSSSNNNDKGFFARILNQLGLL